MSQANVEIVKRAIDAFNRRDVEGLVELTTADFKWFPAMPGIVADDEADAHRPVGHECAGCGVGPVPQRRCGREHLRARLGAHLALLVHDARDRRDRHACACSDVPDRGPFAHRSNNTA